MNADQPPSNPEIVTQSEVEGLLGQIGAMGASGDPLIGSPAKQEDSQPHAFRHLSSFSPNELRKLRMRHEDFVRSLAARLSVHLRLEVGLKMMRLEAVPFEKLQEDFANPTHLTLFKLDPLKGTCLLEILPQLAGSLVDRELGGVGECSEGDRPLTEIECRILSRIIEMSIGEWCLTWSDLLNLKPVMLGHESNGASIQNFHGDTVMLIVGIEMQVGDVIKPIHFAFPYATMEPLIQKLTADADTEIKALAKAAPKVPKWNPLHDDINIKVTAEFPGLKITAKELGNLKAGDVITLEPEVFHHVRISLAKKQKFVATAGKCGSVWAAKITKAIEAGPNAIPNRVG
jgi:flagellar motor switch protein FliM